MAMTFFFSKATRYQSWEKAERQFSLHTHPFKLVLRSPSPFHISQMQLVPLSRRTEFVPF